MTTPNPEDLARLARARIEQQDDRELTARVAAMRQEDQHEARRAIVRPYLESFITYLTDKGVRPLPVLRRAPAGPVQPESGYWWRKQFYTNHDVYRPVGEAYQLEYHTSRDEDGYTVDHGLFVTADLTVMQGYPLTIPLREGTAEAEVYVSCYVPGVERDLRYMADTIGDAVVNWAADYERGSLPVAPLYLPVARQLVGLPYGHPR